ncbi:MAG: hypothetical protein K2Q03_08565 [Sphingobacteriaceae bacterium]|nr:hypothetical protein [Sphingobacteriaceae bacterium]
MNLKKRNLLIPIIGIYIVGCNSGSGGSSNATSSTQLPISVERNNNKLFFLCGKYNHPHNESDLVHGFGGCIAAPKGIRLNPLSKDQEQEALASGGTSSATGMPIESYSLTSGISGFPANFYATLNSNNPNLVPLDQQSFGSCVTFSSTAGLSYLNTNYTSTVSVSPLDLLNRGFIYAGNQVNNSGWDGLSNASDLLSRLSATYGYYGNYNSNIAEYVTLANQYSYGGYTGNLTTAQLTGLPEWNPQFNAYMSNYNNSALPQNQLLNGYTWSPLFKTVSAANKSQALVTALDAGNVVLMDFNIYDSSINESSPACSTYGSNLSPNGNAAYVNINNTLYLEVPNGQNNNTWYWPTGCLMGGHQIWVVGYATDPQSGQLLFVIRNSWGPSGDQGQYYMSESYVQGAASYAAVVQ